MYNRTIYLASDHAGYELQHAIGDRLVALGARVSDLGPPQLDPTDDYPDFIKPVAMRVAAEQEAYGIVFGRSGQGEAIAANRVSGVRAAVYAGGDLDTVRLAREHNDANILSIGAGFVTKQQAWDAVTLFLKTSFSEEPRHRRRIAKLDD